MTMVRSGIRLDVLSQLLRSMKELKSFIYVRSRKPRLKTIQLCKKLIKCSQYSLQNLVIHDYGAGKSHMGDITRFKTLAELRVDFMLLLGSTDEACASLAEVLPMSIETVTLFMRNTCIASEALRKVVLQMIKSKMEHLPKLQALTFHFGGPSNTAARDNLTLLDELKGVSAEVGVRLSASDSLAWE